MAKNGGLNRWFLIIGAGTVAALAYMFVGTRIVAQPPAPAEGAGGEEMMMEEPILAEGGYTGAGWEGSSGLPPTLWEGGEVTGASPGPVGYRLAGAGYSSDQFPYRMRLIVS